MKPSLFFFLLFGHILLIISGCSNNGNNPSASIENYIQALVAKDVNVLVNHSCAAWESEAKNEVNSFAAVSVSLEDLTCRESKKDNDYTLVSCTGKIIANYGNEVLELDLAVQDYLSIYEGGEWRMCGYR